MFKNISSIWQVVGAMLLLILVYLVLTNNYGAKTVITSGGNVVSNLIRNLQGQSTTPVQ